MTFRFCAISKMNLKSGMLTLENFEHALSNIQRQPKQECIKGSRIYFSHPHSVVNCN